MNLIGGYYDAGDNVKFVWPMSFTTTLLSWAAIEYQNEISSVNQLGYLRSTIKWGTDFILRAHTSPNMLYTQVNNLFPGLHILIVYISRIFYISYQKIHYQNSNTYYCFCFIMDTKRWEMVIQIIVVGRGQKIWTHQELSTVSLPLPLVLKPRVKPQPLLQRPHLFSNRSILLIHPHY